MITCVSDFSRLLTVAVSRTPSVLATLRHFGTVSEPCSDYDHQDDSHQNDHQNNPHHPHDDDDDEGDATLAVRQDER